MCECWAVRGKPNHFAANKLSWIDIIRHPRPTSAAMHVLAIPMHVLAFHVLTFHCLPALHRPLSLHLGANGDPLLRLYTCCLARQESANGDRGIGFQTGAP